MFFLRRPLKAHHMNLMGFFQPKTLSKKNCGLFLTKSLKVKEKKTCVKIY